MQAEALAGVIAWSEAPLRAQENLLLIGPSGTGKTHLLAAATRRRLAERGPSVAFVDVPTFRTARSNGDWAAHAELPRLERVDLAVVDDFGADEVTAGTFEFVSMLIEYRFHHNRPTIAASAFTLDELVRRGYATTLRHLTWYEVAFHLDLPGQTSGETASKRIPDLLLRPIPGVVPPICPLV